MLRAVPAGFLQGCASTFFLLIAVKHFDAGPTWKALVSTGPFVGLLVSPWLVVAARRRDRPIMTIASAVIALGGVFFLVALAWPSRLAQPTPLCPASSSTSWPNPAKRCRKATRC